MIDTRPENSFNSGSIKGSINIPYGVFVNSENGTLNSDVQIFENIDFKKPIIVTCGTATTACVADLCLRILGVENSKLYDGSWTEYSLVPEPNFENA